MRANYSTLEYQEKGLSTDPVVQLFALLGAAAQVFLFILYLDPQPVGEKTISQALAITPGTARSRLRKLSRLNLVARSGRYAGYRSIWRGAQLILPICDQRLVEGKDKDQLSSAKNPRSSDNNLLPDHEDEITGIVENPLSSAENRRSNIDDLLPNYEHETMGNIENRLSSAENRRSSNNDFLRQDRENMANAKITPSNTINHHSSVVNPPSLLASTTTLKLLKDIKKQKNINAVVVSNDIQKEILATLYKFHIGKNKALELTNLPYLTVHLIEETARKLKSRGRFSVPLLIHCLQDDPPPVPEKTERSSGSSLINDDYPDLEDNNMHDPDFEVEEEDGPMIDNPAWEQMIATISGNRQLTHLFKNQLDHCTNITITNERITIDVNDHFSYQWLASNARSIIANAFVGIIGRREIVFIDQSGGP